MPIKNSDELTQAVLAEMARAQDERTRELLLAMTRHLHAFVKDVALTEAEFQKILRLIASLGQSTSPSHNEVALGAGSLGISALVCLINNANQGASQTTANLLGPFWRSDSPWTQQGGSIVRGPTEGVPISVQLQICDEKDQAVADAEVDIWHCSAEGFYENQDPTQADMNLRGKFKSDAQGFVRFWSIKPSGYPIPVNGPVGNLIRILGRHNMRPAHIHALVSKEGYKTQFSQIYSADDPNLETDVQFGVTDRLTAHYVLHHEPSSAPGQSATPWYSLDFKLVLMPGEKRYPPPPITARTQGPRPKLEVLSRRGD